MPSRKVSVENATSFMRPSVTVLAPHSMSAWPLAIALNRVCVVTGTHLTCSGDDAELALDHGDDAAAQVDGVAGRLLVDFLERKRQRVGAIGDRDRLRLVDLLEAPVERRRRHLGEGDRRQEAQGGEKRAAARHGGFQG